MELDPFANSFPSPIEDGINDGFKDGILAGREEGFKEGFREGLKSGKEFGSRLAKSILPLLQILQQQNQQDQQESPLVESARKLLSEIGTLSLENEEDPEKEARISQLEAKVKALAVNFSKKVKNVSINRVNNKSSKEELSF